MTARAAFGTVLVALAMVGVGCGGTSKEEYEEEVDRISRELDEQLIEIERDIQASGSLPRAAVDIEKGAEALEDAAADMEEVEPPDDAEGAHADIVDGVGLLADDFQAAARAAGSNDAESVLELFGNLRSREGFRKIADARRDLRDAGYEVANQRR